MAKHHQFLNKTQQGIVRRFYDHKSGIHLTKLQELLSDLAVSDDPKAAAKLWTRVEEYLGKVGAEPAAIAKVLATKDLKALATLVGKLSP